MTVVWGLLRKSIYIEDIEWSLSSRLVLRSSSCVLHKYFMPSIPRTLPYKLELSAPFPHTTVLLPSYHPWPPFLPVSSSPRPSSPSLTMGKREAKQHESWWSRNMVFPSGIESHGTHVGPLHEPRNSVSLCPCSSCYSSSSQHEVYFYPIRPAAPITGTTAVFAPPPPYAAKPKPKKSPPAPSKPSKRSSKTASFIGNRLSTLRRKTSYDTLSSDATSIASKGGSMGYQTDEMSETSTRYY